MVDHSSCWKRNNMDSTTRHKHTQDTPNRPWEKLGSFGPLEWNDVRRESMGGCLGGGSDSILSCKTRVRPQGLAKVGRHPSPTHQCSLSWALLGGQQNVACVLRSWSHRVKLNIPKRRFVVRGKREMQLPDKVAHKLPQNPPTE